jgi:hypothetical protein
MRRKRERIQEIQVIVKPEEEGEVVRRFTLPVRRAYG